MANESSTTGSAIGSTVAEGLDSVRGAAVLAQPLIRTAETIATKNGTLLNLDMRHLPPSAHATSKS